MDEQGVFSLIRNLRAKGIAAGAATTRYERSIASKEAELAEADLKRPVYALIYHNAEMEAQNRGLRAWVREAVSIKCSCCDFCETHKCNPTTCFYRRGQELLEGADGG